MAIPNNVKSYRILQYRYLFTVIALALVTGFGCLASNYAHKDIIGALIRFNFPVLISQNLLLIFMMWQVLRIRPIAPLVGIRRQSNTVQKKLLGVILAECMLYFFFYYLTFILSGTTVFKDGSAIVGILVLLLRFLVLCVLGIIILSAYEAQHPILILLAVLLLNFIYHYWIEIHYLLIMYSPIYDPVYRAIHHIYQG